MGKKRPAEYGGGIKVLSTSMASGSVSPNTLSSVTIDMPSDGSNILAIIPFAISPNSTATGITGTSFKKADISTRKIEFYVYGSFTAQTCAIRYVVIYY